MKKLIEKEGCIWFGYKQGHRVYVSASYWMDNLKFWEYLVLWYFDTFTKYRLTIDCGR